MATKPVLNIHFIHCKSLGMRKPLCDKLVEKLQAGQSTYTIVAKFITLFDPEDVVRMNPESLSDTAPLTEEALLEFNAQLRPLGIPTLSNALKHCAVLRAIGNSATGGPGDIHLVLEDDVCYSENVVAQLTTALAKLPSLSSDWDIMFLGFPAVRDAADKTPEVLKVEPALKAHKILPGCDSYLVTKAGAARLSKDFLKVKFECNVHMSYLIKKQALNAYVLTPNIFIEGSKLGTYVSSLSPNNLLIYNQVYRELFSLVQNQTTYTPQDVANFDKLWAMTPYKGHPDFMYLKGLFLLKREQYKPAKEIMDQCFGQYKKNNCVLNKDSVFLNNYIELFKAVQSSQ